MSIRLKPSGFVKVILFLIILLVVGFVAWYLFAPNNKNNTLSPNAEIYADVTNLEVKTFEECEQAGGVLRTKPIPDKCYYRGVVYYEVIKKGHENLNPPQNLKTYKDCLRQEGIPKAEDSSCLSWAGKVFYYEGPPIKSYDDCMKAHGGPTTEISTKCVAPNGTKFTNPDF